MKNHYIVTIDGPAGSGKSTTARGVAKALNVLHLDTGAMYRAVTLAAMEKGLPPTDAEKLDALSKTLEIAFLRETDVSQRILMNGRDISEAIRTPEVSRAVAAYCTVPQVRARMVQQQQALALQHSVVAEGRDVGTVVFPEARFKFFLTASIEARAERRLAEFKSMGQTPTLQEVMHDISERDRQDSTRSISPLMQAPGAAVVDTTGLSIEEQISRIVQQVKSGLLI
ncbi:MAG: cytidylate kinase [Elusimicrobia bacterium RIFOXYB2_FULL_49_7]|nr:MAG: cytidylate kinase [Elusimicrobia bacterium RIFOXYB2_FULL_49_7]